MANLLVKAGGRQHAYSDVCAVPRQIVGLAALGEIGMDAPVIRVDPFGMARPAQGLQPADMGANKSLRVAADAVDSSSRPLPLLARAVDTFLTGDISNVAVCGARPWRGGAGRDDHAPADFLGPGGIHLDVMQTPVHPVDHQPHPLAHLIAANPLVEHTANDARGRILAVPDGACGRAVL